jgi:hypothetical protein
MKLNEVLSEATANTITVPVAVQIYDEENDKMTVYKVPMTFKTNDLAFALHYLLAGESTGDGGFGMGALDDTLLASEYTNKYKNIYHQKAEKIFNKLGMKY